MSGDITDKLTPEQKAAELLGMDTTAFQMLDPIQRLTLTLLVQLRDEVEAIKAGGGTRPLAETLDQVRTEIRGDIEAFRNEMRDELKDIRSSMRALAKTASRDAAEFDERLRALEEKGS